jgi:exopolysaccharide production protein ExoQ
MAPFALFLSLILSALLVVRDCRRRPSVSAAIWIPTLLMLILGSRPVSLWLGGPQIGGNDAERSTVDQAFHFTVLAGSFVISSSRRVNWRKHFAANPTIMLLYIFFAISILWSGDPLGSSKRLFKDFGLLFSIAVILSEKDPMQAMRAVYVRCACVLFPLSVVFIRYYPSLGREYGRGGDALYSGVTTQKNSLGEIVLVFGLFLIWDHLEARSVGAKHVWGWISWDRLILMLMGVWLLNISQSKTALVCLLIGVALITSRWLASRMISRIVLMVALSVPFLMFFVQRFSSVIAPLVEALGRNMTFTGRTDIWEHINLTTVNPIIGAGYWNFWGGEGGRAIVRIMQVPVPNAHCGYLDIYLDGGVMGLVVLFCMLIASGWRLTANLRTSRYQRVRFAVLIAMIIYKLSESTFLRLGPIWFTTLLALIVFPSLKTTMRK